MTKKQLQCKDCGRHCLSEKDLKECCPMTILEQIKKGFSFGYSAVCKDAFGQSNHVVSIDRRGALFNNGERLDWKTLEKFKITGYKYAGELAGNERIEEGQKFLHKETGDTGEYTHHCGQNAYSVQIIKGKIIKSFNKSEIEPYFG